MTKPEPLFTVKEVANRLRLADESIRRFIRAGDLRAVRIGIGPKAKIRVTESAIQAFLERQRPEIAR